MRLDVLLKENAYLSLGSISIGFDKGVEEKPGRQKVLLNYTVEGCSTMQEKPADYFLELLRLSEPLPKKYGSRDDFFHLLREIAQRYYPDNTLGYLTHLLELHVMPRTVRLYDKEVLEVHSREHGNISVVVSDIHFKAQGSARYVGVVGPDGEPVAMYKRWERLRDERLAAIQQPHQIPQKTAWQSLL